MDKSQFIPLISEVIKKQIVILGPDIAILKARTIPGLKVEEDGSVKDYSGDPKEVVKSLVNIYVELSGMIVKSALTSVFDRYPEMQDLKD